MIYQFHLHDGGQSSNNDEIELADLDTARLEAVRFFAAVMYDEPARFWSAEEWTLSVADDQGLSLFTLSLIACDAPALKRE